MTMHDEHERPPTHPAQRPAEPEHPMMLDGAVVPGDVRLMATCMVEELLMIGTSPAQIRQMSLDSNYQALHAARHTMGGAAMDDLIAHAAQRVGHHAFNECELRGDVQAVELTIGARDRSSKRE